MTNVDMEHSLTKLRAKKHAEGTDHFKTVIRDRFDLLKMRSDQREKTAALSVSEN